MQRHSNNLQKNPIFWNKAENLKELKLYLSKRINDSRR